MRFGLFFFGVASDRTAEVYSSILDLARWAETVGFSFVSIPERHFHRFGGAFPNPHILIAALAERTTTIQLRYGSLIGPLHDAIEIAENLAMVQLLSRGRVAVSFGSGWNRADFIGKEDRYATRRDLMWNQIHEIVEILRDGNAHLTADHLRRSVTVFPRASEYSVPIWITASGNPDTFRRAGTAGYNLLTHLEKSSLATLAKNIETYQRARLEAGHTAPGFVTVMMHTFITDQPATLEAATEALRRYLATAVDLERGSLREGDRMSGGRVVDASRLDNAVERDALIEVAIRKYMHSSSLIGPLDHCGRVVRDLHEIGVSEIACLLDFAEHESLVQGLAGLEALVRHYSNENLENARSEAIRRLMKDD